MLDSLFLKEWIVSWSFQSIVFMYRGLASMEKTDNDGNIFLDELDCKLVLVFHCTNHEEKERGKEEERKRKKQSEKHKQRERNTERERERKAGKK